MNMDKAYCVNRECPHCDRCGRFLFNYRKEDLPKYVWQYSSEPKRAWAACDDFERMDPKQTKPKGDNNV
jgi:hypothetical protein